MSTETQTRQKTTTGIRKKPFAVPPVKVACLSWCVWDIGTGVILLADGSSQVAPHVLDVTEKNHVRA